MRISRAKLAKVEGIAKLKISIYPGPLGRLCALGVLGARKSWISDHYADKLIQIGGMKIPSQLANNFDYCKGPAAASFQ